MVGDVEHQPGVVQTEGQDVAVIDWMAGGVQGADLKIQSLLAAEPCRVETRNLDAGTEKVERGMCGNSLPVPIGSHARVLPQAGCAPFSFEHIFRANCDAAAVVAGLRILIGVE